MKYILGSGSKSRKMILENAGYAFDVMVPDIDEMAIRTENWRELPLLIARAKMDALLQRIAANSIFGTDREDGAEPTILITADQVTVCGNALHEKPKSEEEARAFLKKYSDGQIPQTVSALVVHNLSNGKQADGVDIVSVYFDSLPDSVVDDFIQNGEPLTKSGGFAIESPILRQYIRRVDGTEDSVTGMPLALLSDLVSQVS